MTYFQTGDSLHRNLPAAFMNEVAAMLEWWRSTQQHGTGGGPLEYRAQQVNIYCRNQDTVDLGLNAPVRLSHLSQVAIEPESDGSGNWRESLLVNCYRADDQTARHGNAGITQEPIPCAANSQQPAGIGLVCIQGVSPVKLQVNSADHKFAQVKSGDYERLHSANFGAFEIISRSVTSGEGWALVKVGEHHPLPGVYTSGGGTSGTVGSSETPATFGTPRGYVPYAEMTTFRLTAKRDLVGVGFQYGGAVYRATVPAAPFEAHLIFKHYNASGSVLLSTTHTLTTIAATGGKRGVAGVHFARMNEGDYIEAFFKSTTSDTFNVSNFDWAINGFSGESQGVF